MKTFYYHEDDYLQTEIVPVSAVSDSATDHERFELIVVPMPEWNGESWQSVFVRKDCAQLYHSLNLTPGRLDEILQGRLARFDSVQTGYGSFREPCFRTTAWVDEEGSALLAECAPSGLVETFWLLYRYSTELSRDRWLSTFDSLHSLVPSFVVDNCRWFTVSCANRPALRACLSGALDPPDGG